ncbi:hypothetical protein CF15_06355 [Pyrodictium occultum]|uniref:Uncharacterized protein n=1 Tax=Pyrodictium occultum TaxID=2309 RepID=A0A0V8RWD4_PYROC|nr:hypothetical protein [Pyrodictium occultum]KSW12357.1 hypothetical protein CF15_06355 [Pyrodictium occultum]
MGRKKRLVRVFFNTYYEDVARDVVKGLEGLGYPVRMSASRVVPELYYAEIEVGEGDLGKAVEEARRLLEEAKARHGGLLFGVKVYGVDASSE